MSPFLRHGISNSFVFSLINPMQMGGSNRDKVSIFFDGDEVSGYYFHRYDFWPTFPVGRGFHQFSDTGVFQWSYQDMLGNYPGAESFKWVDEIRGKLGGTVKLGFGMIQTTDGKHFPMLMTSYT